MAESVDALREAHPNITVKAVLQSTDTYNTTQKTACKAAAARTSGTTGAAPGRSSWPGSDCTVPNEDVLSADDIKPCRPSQGTSWGGKTWVYPIELRIFPIVYNKELFKKAGLDPDQPPKTWAEFLAAGEKLKKAGITPIVTGLKDGFGGEIPRRRRCSRRSTPCPSSSRW